MKSFAILALLVYLSLNSFAQESYKSFFSDRIIFKIKPGSKNDFETGNYKDAALVSFLGANDIKSIKKIFPKSGSPKSKFNERGEPLVDLSLIYEIKFNSISDIQKAVGFLRSLSYVEYAQPRYIEKIFAYVPNDPYLDSNYQWNIFKIHATEAWAICKGDSNVVIGISDTGNDNDHEDLRDNVYYNYNDTINGIDDDNDGYTDNFRGWDFAENDNDPQVESNPAVDPHTRNHGIYVAGFAAARTDNGKGIAGTGFRCKYLPVKVLNSDGVIVAGYESIVYAADHGANIINCSWGGNVGHPFGQDIINYATYNRNSLVVASAGNDGNSCLFYPASYDNVLSVAGTNQNDVLQGSNFGIEVDIAGPAIYMLTTFNDSYSWVYSGTSFSAPIVSGCAAIVKSHFPTFTALQIGERLRVTADNIDTIVANAPYQELLGGGRVNLLRALTDPVKPSVRFKNYSLTDNNDRIFKTGDTVSIKGTFINYLGACTGLVVYATSNSSYVDFVYPAGPINIGVLGTFDTVTNYTQPFKFKIKAGTPYDTKIDIKLTFIDFNNNYSGKQYIRLIANPSFLNIDTNKINTTLTSRGKFGYSNYCPLCGTGFTYKDGENLLYEGGLMIGTASNKVSDCVRGNNDFAILHSVEKADPAVVSDFDAYTEFNDDSAYLSKIKIDIEQRSYAWNNQANDNFVMVFYDITNKNSLPVTNLYAGIFADWDIYDYSKNRVGFESARKLAYTYCTTYSTVYAGIQLLSDLPVKNYAIDFVYGGNNGIDITDDGGGFTTAKKYLTLSEIRNEAGVIGQGNDVCVVLGSGPFTMGASDTITLAFALLAAENLQALINAAEAAQELYDSVFVSSKRLSYDQEPGFSVFPNPVKNSLSIHFTIIKSDRTRVNIYNLLGVKVAAPLDAQLTAGAHSFNFDTRSLENGTYIVEFISSGFTCSRKIVIAR